MQSDAVRAAIQAAGLTRIQPHLEALMTNSIRVTSTASSEKALPVGSSKIGGAPDLPEAVIWPLMADVPLSFVAQFDLSAVAPLDVNKLLPASGLLSFFFDANQQVYGSDPSDKAGWKVIYSAGDKSTLKRRTFPDKLPKEAQFTPCSVTFSAEVTLPQRPNLLDKTLDWNDKERYAYSDFIAAFPSEADRKTLHHRLLGYSDDLQDDMHLQAQLVSHGFKDDQSPEAKALVSGAADWLLLFQLDSDFNAHMQWASTGLLYYWITKQDLQAKNFDKVWCVLQSE
ncbi:MAG: YwqG family protein [Chloroflexota bacterium]